jgi:GNAT superfamily N-acetyltransferase
MAAPPSDPELLLPADLEADPAFWDLYTTAFPPSETEPRAVVLATARPGTGWVARTRSGGRTVAMAALQFLEAEPVGFLVYLAVAPDLKGQGLGGELFEGLRAKAEREHPDLLGLVWEVDRLEDAAGEEGRRTRARRLRFFEAHGGRIAPGSYLQPAVDGTRVVPMHLFHRPFREPVPDPATFPLRLARAIYREKYGALNGISPLHLEDLLAGRLPPRPAFPA